MASNRKDQWARMQVCPVQVKENPNSDSQITFNEYVHEIVSENDDKNQMVLDNFQPEHDNPCNDEGSKKESKNYSFIESVDIIEKDKSDNDLIPF